MSTLLFHGVGSLNSPIVISDDEDEAAFVEFALEQRLSSPHESVDDDDLEDTYEYWSPRDGDISETLNQPPAVSHLPVEVPPNGTQDHRDGPSIGQKRKRSDSLHPPQAADGQPFHSSGKGKGSTFPGPPGESRSARKKRRRRERLAAEAVLAQQEPGPSTSEPLPLALPPPLPPPQVRTSKWKKEKNVVRPIPSFDTLPPKPFPTSVLLAMEPVHPPFAPLPLAEPAPYDHPIAHPFLPTIAPNLKSFMPPFSLPFPEGMADNVLLPLEPPASHGPSSPVASLPSPSSNINSTLKKPIGMPPDADPHSQHGVYILSPSSTYVPNPARSLVMELLPKKFRTVSFIQKWALSMGPKTTVNPRIELDIKVGKALVEFPSAELARAAWESARMHGEGKEHIRVYWYRLPGVGADAGVGELEEGEIEDGELSKHVPKKAKQKMKEQKRNPSSPIAPFKSQPFSPSLHFPPSISFPEARSSVGSSQSSSNSLSQSMWFPSNTATSANQSSVLAPSLSRSNGKEFQSRLHPSSPVSPVVGNISAHASLPPRPLASTSSITLRSLSSRLQSPEVSLVKPSLSSRLGPMAPEAAEPIADSAIGLPLPPMDEAMDLSSEDSFNEATMGPPPRVDSPDKDMDDVSIASSRAASPMSSPGCSSNHAHSGTAPGLATEPFYSGSHNLLGLPALPPDASPPGLRVSNLSPLSQTDVSQDTSYSVDTSLLIRSSLVTAQAALKCSKAFLDVAASSCPVPMPPLSESALGLTPSTPRASASLKQSLMARQKELEATIARRTKDLMGSRSSGSRSATETPSLEIESMLVDSPISSDTSSSPSPRLPSTSESLRPPVLSQNTLSSVAKEDELRRMVLSNKKLKATVNSQSNPPRSPAPEGEDSVTSHADITQSSVKASAIDFDNLAVSFIAETIKTVSSPLKGSLSPVSAPQVAPDRLSDKEILFAKQKLLASKISESKEFMAQYQAAPTKVLKTQIMQRMEARMRALDEDMKALGNAVGPKAAPVFRRRWPEPEIASLIIDISDDEDE